MKTKQLGNYTVYSDGRVFTKPRRGVRSCFRKLTLDRTGYLRVALCFNGAYTKYLVHRLVAEAFLPNPESKPQVNHINGIKTDNRVENLEWCTSSENIAHAYATGLTINHGDNNGNSKLNEQQVHDIRALKGKMSQRKIAAVFGVSQCQVHNILSGKQRNKEKSNG